MIRCKSVLANRAERPPEKLNKQMRSNVAFKSLDVCIVEATFYLLCIVVLRDAVRSDDSPKRFS